MTRVGNPVNFGNYRIECDEYEGEFGIARRWLVWVLDEDTREPIGEPKHADISPYHDGEHTVKLWILAGLPTRQVLNKTCPLDRDDLLRIVNEKRKQAANAVLMRWNGGKVDELVEKIRDACDPLSVRYVECDTLADDSEEM